MVRWAIDDSLLPPEKRAGAEASKFIGIRVEVANHGCDPVLVDAMYFRLMAGGLPYGRTASIALEPLLAGQLADGARVTGGLAFEVPDSSKAVTLEFTSVAGVNVRYADIR